jgi:hypothetical protein
MLKMMGGAPGPMSHGRPAAESSTEPNVAPPLVAASTSQLVFVSQRPMRLPSVLC